jgi:hypothetical protein
MIRALWEQAAALVLVASLLTGLLGLFRVARGGWGMRIAAALTALLGLVPIRDVSAAGMVLGFSPSLSVAGTFLWGFLLYRCLRGRGQEGGMPVEGLAGVILVVSVPVYISFTGGIGPDIYDSGYGFTLWDIVLGISAVLLFISGSWISLVLMACLLAHASGLMASSNIFDTLVDGPSFVLSTLMVLRASLTSRQPLPNRPRL